MTRRALRREYGSTATTRRELIAQNAPLGASTAEIRAWVRKQNAGKRVVWCEPCNRMLFGTEAENADHERGHDAV